MGPLKEQTCLYLVLGYDFLKAASTASYLNIVITCFIVLKLMSVTYFCKVCNSMYKCYIFLN